MQTSETPENLLVQRAIANDRDAFANLYENNVARVSRYVYYRVHSQVDAEDITQEVFIRAWKAINRYSPRGVSFGAWLIAIAHNLIIDHFRAKKQVIPLDSVADTLPSNDKSPTALSEVNFDRIQVKQAVFKLAPDKQKVVVMRFVDGLSCAEVAQLLNKSEGAVRVIQHRALKDLRRLMGQADGK